MMARFQAWGGYMNDGGPDRHEETETGTQLVGEEPEFLLDSIHCSDTWSRCQGNGGKYCLKRGRGLAPKETCQHCGREKRKAQQQGGRLNQLWHIGCVDQSPGRYGRWRGEKRKCHFLLYRLQCCLSF